MLYFSIQLVKAVCMYVCTFVHLLVIMYFIVWCIANSLAVNSCRPPESRPQGSPQRVSTSAVASYDGRKITFSTHSSKVQ